MIKHIKNKLYSLFLHLAIKTTPDDIILIPMTVKEYGDFLEFQDSLFIVYETEEDLLGDFPNAKPVKK